MSSNIKLKNANNKTLTLVNPDTVTVDSTINVLENAYTIATVNDFSTVPSGVTTVIVKDTDRGGVFNRIASTTANGGTIFDGTTGYSWERQYSGAVNVKWFGAVGDGVTDDTAAIQAAINTGNNILLPSGFTFYISSITVNTSINIFMENSKIRVSGGNAINITANSVVIQASGAEIYSSTTYSGGAIIYTSSASNISNFQLLGFPTIIDNEGLKSGTFTGINVSKFYRCVIQANIFNFIYGIYRNDTVACYYNKFELSLFNNNYGFTSTGALFNGNIINIYRCASNTTSIRITNGDANVLNITYLEGTTTDGIYLEDTNGTTILGGAIEGSLSTTGYGVHAIGCEGTTIIGTEFGSGYSSSIRRLNFNSSCKNTTYLGRDNGDILNFNGAISSVGAGVLNRLYKTITDGDTTPSVSELYKDAIIYATHSTPTEITNFDDGIAFQKITIVPNSANTTLKHSAGNGIRLSGGVNVTLFAFQSITLVKIPTALGTTANWIEISRS